MKVRELINKLLKENPDADVIIQKDSEGNGYSPLRDVDGKCVYIPETDYSGTVYDTRWTAYDANMEEYVWQRVAMLPGCVVLSPMN